MVFTSGSFTQKLMSVRKMFDFAENVFLRSAPPQQHPLCTSVRYVLTHVVSRCLLLHVKPPTLSLLIQLKACKTADLRLLNDDLIWRISQQTCFYQRCFGSIAEFSLNRTILSSLALFSVIFAGWARPHRETQGSHVRPACREEVADLLQQKEGRSITELAADGRLALDIILFGLHELVIDLENKASASQHWFAYIFYAGPFTRYALNCAHWFGGIDTEQKHETLITQ